jgi:hypothetical protein
MLHVQHVGHGHSLGTTAPPKTDPDELKKVGEMQAYSVQRVLSGTCEGMVANRKGEEAPEGAW